MEGAAKKILIAEDEQALASALKLKFEQMGYAADIAANGKIAVDILSKAAYDLVLLDLLMPEMDGWQVLSELKSKKMKVLVVSNLSQGEDIQKAKDLGALDFLVKADVSLSEIVDHAKKYL